MDSLFEAAQSFLWRCWTTLGVGGVSEPFGDLLIDPEGLLVLSGVALRDTRLSDEVVDWSARYFSYVSASRLKNLVRLLSDEERASVYELTARVNAVSPVRWPSGDEKKTEVIRLSGKSRLPSLESPALAHLRYRALFGTTSRAEILLDLGRHVEARSAAEIARATGYAKRIVARTLDELAQGGVVVALRSGNRLNFELRSRKRLDAFAGSVAEGGFAWTPWARIIGVYEATRSAKASVRRIELARVLSEIGHEKTCFSDAASVTTAFINDTRHDRRRSEKRLRSDRAEGRRARRVRPGNADRRGVRLRDE